MNSLPIFPLKSSLSHSGLQWLKSHTRQLAESFWFCLTFCLFVLMGPFSAVAVLIGLGSLASKEKREKMPEPARLLV